MQVIAATIRAEVTAAIQPVLVRLAALDTSVNQSIAPLRQERARNKNRVAEEATQLTPLPNDNNVMPHGFEVRGRLIIRHR